MMLMKRGEFDYAYNAQACMDEGHGVIVVADLSNEVSDTGHLPEMVKEVRQLRDDLHLSEMEKETLVTADRGYFSVENIKQEGEGIELLIASGREGKEEPAEVEEGVYSLERFEYVKESDFWRYRGDRFLVRENKQVSKGRPLLRRYECQDCGGCSLRRNQFRGYHIVFGILKAESEDDLCRNCIGLEGAIIKVEKGLKKLKLDLADFVAPEEEKNVFTNQIDWLSKQVSSLPSGEEPT